MKHLLAVAMFLLVPVAFAGNPNVPDYPSNSGSPYFFVQDFALKSVVVDGSVATITVEHRESIVPPRFELVPGQACAESYPAQCYGTVVRLDDSGSTNDMVESVFKVDLAKLYYDEGVVVSIFGPKSKMIHVQY